LDAKTLLIASMVALTLVYLTRWFLVARARLAAGGHGAHEPVWPTPLQLFIGAVTNFFDTLGIGSFAPTTALFRAWKLVPDEQIPGTLNVGHVVPTVTQAVIFTTLVKVEFTTLALMLAAAACGAWFGASIVAGLSRRAVRLGMGTALLGAAVIVLAQILDVVPSGEALALSGTRLWIGVGVNLVLGALMTLGLGLYAPCMVLVSLLGMDPSAAFPIMMGSCAVLMPVASFQFLNRDAYNLRAALGLALGGPLAVIVAVKLFTSLPTPVVRGLVLCVVLYTAVTLLFAATSKKPA
jgi:uncharacterized membrane protein YfcA